MTLSLSPHVFLEVLGAILVDPAGQPRIVAHVSPVTADGQNLLALARAEAHTTDSIVPALVVRVLEDEVAHLERERESVSVSATTICETEEKK